MDQDQAAEILEYQKPPANWAEALPRGTRLFDHRALQMLYCPFNRLITNLPPTIKR